MRGSVVIGRLLTGTWTGADERVVGGLNTPGMAIGVVGSVGGDIDGSKRPVGGSWESTGALWLTEEVVSGAQ